MRFVYQTYSLEINLSNNFETHVLYFYMLCCKLYLTSMNDRSIQKFKEVL